jgi:hypothetical protein
MLQTDNESFAALLSESFQNLDSNLNNETNQQLYQNQHDASRRKSDTLLRTDVDKSKLKNFDNDINDLSIIPSSDHNYIKSSISNQVEILNLKNTTVLVPPDNVKIIKEIDNPSNRNRLSLGTANNLTKTKPQQTNEIFADEDGRLFFSLTTTNTKHKSTSSLSSSSSSSAIPAKSTKPKVAEQINNMYRNIDDEFRSLPVKTRTVSLSTTASTNLRRPNSPPIPPTTKIHSSSSEPLMRSLKLNSHKMSLQEAFETYRHDLVIRSRERQKNIQLKAEKRMALAQLRLKNAEIEDNFKLENRRVKKYDRDTKNQVEKQIRRPQLSTNEIKQITRKNYEKLPEVKERQAKQRIETDRKLNRFRSSIYQKVL